MKKKQFFGFTIGEAVIALIFFAIVIAASTPFITKKILNIAEGNSFGGEGHGRYEIYMQEFLGPNKKYKKILVSKPEKNYITIYRKLNDAEYRKSRKSDPTIKYENNVVKKSTIYVEVGKISPKMNPDGTITKGKLGDLEFVKGDKYIFEDTNVTYEKLDNDKKIIEGNLVEVCASNKCERIDIYHENGDKIAENGAYYIIENLNNFNLERTDEPYINRCNSKGTNCKSQKAEIDKNTGEIKLPKLPANIKEITIHAVGGGGAGGSYPDAALKNPIRPNNAQEEVLRKRLNNAFKEAIERKGIDKSAIGYSDDDDVVQFYSGTSLVQNQINVDNNPFKYMIDNKKWILVNETDGTITVRVDIRYGAIYPNDLLRYTERLGALTQKEITYDMPDWFDINDIANSGFKLGMYACGGKGEKPTSQTVTSNENLSGLHGYRGYCTYHPATPANPKGWCTTRRRCVETTFPCACEDGGSGCTCKKCNYVNEEECECPGGDFHICLSEGGSFRASDGTYYLAPVCDRIQGCGISCPGTVYGRRSSVACVTTFAAGEPGKKICGWLSTDIPSTDNASISSAQTRDSYAGNHYKCGGYGFSRTITAKYDDDTVQYMVFNGSQNGKYYNEGTNNDQFCIGRGRLLQTACNNTLTGSAGANGTITYNSDKANRSVRKFNNHFYSGECLEGTTCDLNVEGAYGLGTSITKLYNYTYFWTIPYAINSLVYGNSGNAGEHKSTKIQDITGTIYIKLGLGGIMNPLPAGAANTGGDFDDDAQEAQATSTAVNNSLNGTSTVVSILKDNASEKTKLLEAKGGAGGSISQETLPFDMCFNAIKPEQFNGNKSNNPSFFCKDPDNSSNNGGSFCCAGSQATKTTRDIQTTNVKYSKLDSESILASNSKIIGLGLGRGAEGMGSSTFNEELIGTRYAVNASTDKNYQGSGSAPKRVIKNNASPFAGYNPKRDNYNNVKISPQSLNASGGGGAVIIIW